MDVKGAFRRCLENLWESLLRGAVLRDGFLTRSFDVTIDALFVSAYAIKKLEAPTLLIILTFPSNHPIHAPPLLSLAFLKPCRISSPESAAEAAGHHLRNARIRHSKATHTGELLRTRIMATLKATDVPRLTMADRQIQATRPIQGYPAIREWEGPQEAEA